MPMISAALPRTSSRMAAARKDSQSRARLVRTQSQIASLRRRNPGAITTRVVVYHSPHSGQVPRVGSPIRLYPQ